MIKLRVEIHFPFWLMEELTEKAVDWNPSVGTYKWSWFFRDSSAVVFTGKAMEGFGFQESVGEISVSRKAICLGYGWLPVGFPMTIWIVTWHLARIVRSQDSFWWV